jgi:hypothetical protein
LVGLYFGVFFAGADIMRATVKKFWY